jgi:murein DD-endopeptidase MepM/ murein hydrolase activator NlpD
MGPITTLGQIYELAKKMKAVQDLFDRQRYSSAMYEAHRLAETLRQRIAARQIDGTRGLALVARLQDLHGRAQAARPATAFPFERGAEVTSNYGWRIHPVYGDRRFHQGTDIGLDRGADVYASGAGTVEFAGWISGYGRQMQVRLDDGALVTYSHLLNYNDLSQGDRVSAGDVVGHVNASGIGTGDHLHLEVWDANGNRQNPRDWFDF